MGVLDSAISATAQVIPLAATAGVLHSLSRRRAAPKPKRRRRKPVRCLRRHVAIKSIKRVVRKAPPKRRRR